MPDLWDPLIWLLYFKERALKRRGFVRRRARIQSEKFGYYLGGDQGASPPLVLVHGLALFPEWWSPLLVRLEADRSICVPELLGFGRSPGRSLPSSAFNLSLYRKQLDLLRDGLGRDPIILAGVSLGGWVCLDYALARPDAVAGLILYAPAGADPNVDEKDLEGLRRLFDYRSPSEFDRLINDFVLFRPRRIPWWISYLALKRAQRNGHKHLLHNLTFDDWVGERVNDIQAPTALIWGRQDKVFPFRTGEILARDMPNARLFPMENTGHSYLFEEPEASCQAFFKALGFVRNG